MSLVLLCHPSRRQFAAGYLAGTGESYPIKESSDCPPDKVYIVDEDRIFPTTHVTLEEES